MNGLYFNSIIFKEAVLLILAFLFISGCTDNSDENKDSNSAQTTASYKAELMAMEKEWIDAEVNDDKETLERILDESFLATFASGKTVDRSAYIEVIINMEIEPFEVINESINIHRDTAVIIDISTDLTTKFTWIAIKRKGEWRVISETFTNI